MITRIAEKAKEALQWETESLLSHLFEGEVSTMTYAKRKTVYLRDLHLAICMKGYESDVLGHWKQCGPTNWARENGRWSEVRAIWYVI